MTTAALPPAISFVGKKIAGLTLIQWLDSNAECHWFDAKEDAGTRRLVYLYFDKSLRDRARTRIHGFHTTVDDLGTDLGSPKIPVFATIGDHRVMMGRSLRQHLTSAATMPARIDDYEVEEVLGYGYKGVTYRVHRAAGVSTPYALKLTIGEEYADGSYLAELNRMVDLSARDRVHFPRIHGHGEWQCSLASGGETHQLVFFVEDFIGGKTLADHINLNRDTVTVTFLEQFLREMLGAIAILQDLSLMHDDLHAGNIIIDEGPASAHPVIIDFGSTKPRADTKKKRDDIRQLASHISDITNIISSRATARSRYEDSVIAAIENLLAHMSDDDPLRRPNDAIDLLHQFDSHSTRGSFKQTLTHPFDFGNAEEVLDNELLYKLAAKSFPWGDRLQSSSNLLVIGPRGCGKTTVFRAMSFTCLADAGEIDDALARSYVGLYISCNKEFRQRFSALPPDTLVARAGEIRHYFSLLVVRELTSALLSCRQHGHLQDADIRNYRRFLADRLGAPLPQLDSDSALRDIEALIGRAIHATRASISDNVALPFHTDQGFVADLARFVNGSLSAFLGKVVYLLVDDYTERKVPKEVQQALNHILFVPNSIYKSKISSEVFGVTPDEAFGTFLDQDRDYKEWNLGTLYYLTLPSQNQKEFLREIVDNRLHLCGFSGRVADVIGPSVYSQGTLARALKLEAEARLDGRRRPAAAPQSDEPAEDAEEERPETPAHYHGWDTICDLCTGDISNILELLARLYADSRVTKWTHTPIPPSRQSDVIQAYSLQYIGKIKGLPIYGDKLFELVDAFGSMSARLLTEHPWRNRGEGREDPYQLLRIELDEGLRRAADVELERYILGPQSTERGGGVDLPARLWMLLQRHSIFIDADESRSRRNTLASKVILRRIFAPAFKTTLVNSESFTLDKRQWAEFCADPKGTADRYVRDSVFRANRREQKQQTQPGLFD